jgi:hypothetical protein
MKEISLGRSEEATHSDSLKAMLVEFFFALIFIYAYEGSVMVYSKKVESSMFLVYFFGSDHNVVCISCFLVKLTHNDSTTFSNLVAVALVQSLDLFLAKVVRMVKAVGINVFKNY